MNELIDFSAAERNPFIQQLIDGSLSIDPVTESFFKALAEESASVFEDPMALTERDPYHPNTPDRRLLIGISAEQRIVVVRFVYDESAGLIHLGTARLAHEREQAEYERRKEDPKK